MRGGRGTQFFVKSWFFSSELHFCNVNVINKTKIIFGLFVDLLQPTRTVLSYERVQPVSTRTLSLVVKPPNVNNKLLTTPKLGTQKTASVIAFRIALALDVQIVWFGRQVAVCVNKWHKNSIFGCSKFFKLNFG